MDKVTRLVPKARYNGGPKLREKCCDNCRWFDPDHEKAEFFDAAAPDEIEGWCRRYPPATVKVEDSASYGVWPKVGGQDWCGEWELEAPSDQDFTPIIDSED